MAYGESKAKLGNRGKSDGDGFNKSSGTQKSTFLSGCGNCWQGKEIKGKKFELPEREDMDDEDDD